MSNIPKGATHYLQDMGDTIYYREKGDWFDCWFDGLGWELIGNKRSQLSGLVELNKKPVFTQAIADAGNMVEAGMLFETEAGQYAAEYTNKKSVCFTDENGFLVTVTRGNAKPIDTRTDKEKAIDDLLDKSVIFCNKDTMRTCFKIAYDEWAAKSDE